MEGEPKANIKNQEKPQEENSAQSTSSKLNGQRSLLLGLILLVILFAGISAYLGYRNYQLGRKVDVSQNMASEGGTETESTSTPTPAYPLTGQFSDEEAVSVPVPYGWKTYRDDKYGFEFKHPLHFELVGVEDVSEDERVITLQSPSDPESFTGSDFEEQIYVRILRTDMSVEDYVAQRIGIDELVYGKVDFQGLGLDTPVTVIGQVTVEEKTFVYYHVAGAGAGDWYYFTKHPESDFVVSSNAGYGSGISDDEQVATFRRVLASFRFTQ